LKLERGRHGFKRCSFSGQQWPEWIETSKSRS